MIFLMVATVLVSYTVKILFISIFFLILKIDFSKNLKHQFFEFLGGPGPPRLIWGPIWAPWLIWGPIWAPRLILDFLMYFYSCLLIFIAFYIELFRIPDSGFRIPDSGFRVPQVSVTKRWHEAPTHRVVWHWFVYSRLLPKPGCKGIGFRQS